MTLKDQVQLYSIDTNSFYHADEQEQYDEMSELYLRVHKLKNTINRLSKLKVNFDIESELDEVGLFGIHKRSNSVQIRYMKDEIKNIRREIRERKEKFKKKIESNNVIRTLNQELVTDRHKVSIFTSALTKVLGIDVDTLTEDIIIVQTFYFEILKDIIYKGFYYKGEKYIMFTASAGQIRQKKNVFIKESSWNEHKKTLMCGLTEEKINEIGGCNVNKFLAYLALNNSATEELKFYNKKEDKYEDFDIDRCIVVDDLETKVDSVVDFIDEKTYEIHKNKQMEIPIEHTDGCGLLCDSMFKKDMMVRLPFIKGLCTVFPVKKFLREHKGSSPIVKDIYGKEWNIIKNDIKIIFTKSQFKMWKYYESWEEYKQAFKDNKCLAGKCNEEPDEFKEARINYQMLQTLSNMSDDDIEYICQRTNDTIHNVGRDKETMMKLVGATDDNEKKTHFQQAVSIYPELLRDNYSKEIIKSIKASLVKDAKAGKLEIKATYLFILPDMYAFCERLFLKKENPQGLLKKGEVFCNFYADTKKLDLMRAPHLYREHGVRINKGDDTEIKRWFPTNGIVTSIHDDISKLLQFDVDGDKSLVCADERFVSIAEEHMKGINALYYEMKSAQVTDINNENIYKGLSDAYVGGNIGMISNDITKIWNSSDINIDAVRLLCMENNFVIDQAKTLYTPTRPQEKNEILKKYAKLKTPHFFIYAKDKTQNHVEPINSSVMNRVSEAIKNPRIKFDCKNIGKIDYKMLMNNPKLKINEDQESEIIARYEYIDSKSYFDVDKSEDFNKFNHVFRNQYKYIKGDKDVRYVTDVLVRYLYNRKKSCHKDTLWSCFGSVIVENIEKNLKEKYKEETIQCEECGVRITKEGTTHIYCKKCGDEISKIKTLERVRKHRACNGS